MIIGYTEDKKANYIAKILKKNIKNYSINNNSLIVCENSNHIIRYFSQSAKKSILVTDKNIHNDIIDKKYFIIDFNNVNINEYDLNDDFLNFYINDLIKLKNSNGVIIYYNSKINNANLLNNHYYSNIIIKIIEGIKSLWKINEYNKVEVFTDSFSPNLLNELSNNKYILNFSIIYSSYKYSEIKNIEIDKKYKNYIIYHDLNLLNVNDEKNEFISDYLINEKELLISDEEFLLKDNFTNTFIKLNIKGDKQ